MKLRSAVPLIESPKNLRIALMRAIDEQADPVADFEDQVGRRHHVGVAAAHMGDRADDAIGKADVAERHARRRRRFDANTRM